MDPLRRCSSLLVCLAAALGAAGTQSGVSFLTRPLSFEPNVGQSASSALFLSRGVGIQVELHPDSVTFQVESSRTIRMNLLNVEPDCKLRGEGMLPGKANYFSGTDAARWHTDIPTYARVTEQNLYPGVDAAFYGNPSRFEYDFVLRPHAAANQIQLSFTGADRVSIDADGDLVLEAGKRKLSLLKPVAYQMAQNGKRKESVAARYVLDAKSGIVSFGIDAYDRARPLIIDPVLTYSEYLSSPINASAMDKSGNIYVVTGSSYSTSSISKLSSTGVVIYTTSFGEGLSPSAVAVDAAGKAYISGFAAYNSTLPVTSNAYSSSVPQNTAAFLLEVSANGSSLPYASYLGGTDNTETVANAIAVDSSGNAYLAGVTQSSSFPTTPGAYQTVNSPYYTAGFVSKFNPSLSGKASLVYSTLIGSAQYTVNPTLNGIAVDATGDAYVTGLSAPGYPVTSGAFQYTGAHNADGGVYVTKFNPTGTALVYSAYLGYGTGNAIAVDGQGNAYVTGTVEYADFPVTTGAYQTIYPGGFVSKLNPAGSAEIFSTFLGGPSSVQQSYVSQSNVLPASIALSPGCPAATPVVINCNVYVAGTTSTTDFPLINPLQSSADSTASAFVTELSATGQSALFSTYLSGTAALTTGGPFVAVDSAGNISLTGNAVNGYESSFPVTVPSTSNINPAFFARISPAGGGELLAMPAAVTIGSDVGISSSLLGETAKVTLGNFSGSSVTIQSIKVSPSSFTQTNNCGTSLAAGASCVLTVNFTATAATTTTGSITVTSTAGNSPLNIGLTGSGYNAGYLQASVSNLTFGDQAVETSSKPATITLSNIGNEAIAATITPEYPLDFSQVNNCPAQLAAHASCIITVTFLPTQLGLRSGGVVVQDSPDSSSVVVSLAGTGVLPGVTPGLQIVSSVQFAAALVGSNSQVNVQSVAITNTGIEPVSLGSVSTAGDFQVTGTSCGTPGQINPLATCYVDVMFTPTAAGSRAGTLIISDSISFVQRVVALSGTGLASSQSAEIYPSTSLVVPNQPVGTTGPDQVITFQNTGTAPISIYRIVAAGPFRVSADPCTSSTVAGTNDDGAGNYSFCQVSVDFVPTTTGTFSGTLTFYDSAAGSPHVVNLSGTGITATGTLALSDNALTFPAQAVGTSVGSQGITLYNPGDSPIQITAITTTGDFTQSPGYSCGGQPPFTIGPGDTYCAWNVMFSPSAVGTRTGTLTVHSSAGVQTATLTGTGIAANNFLQLVPASSMSFGSEVVGQSGGSQTIYFYGNGVVANAYPTYTVSGPNAADFNVDYDIGCGGGDTNITFCMVNVAFTPSAPGTRTATITFTDWAGTQTLHVSGTGLTSAPTYSVFPQFFSFPVYPPQAQGITSAGLQVTFTNSSAAAVSLANVSVTSNYIIPHVSDACSGATVAAGQTCNLLVAYAPAIANPPANRLDSGTLTIRNTGGAVLASVPLAAFSLAPTYSAQLSQNELNFAQQQALGFTSDYQTVVSLQNTGNTPLTVGQIGGTNFGPAGPSAEFSILTGGDYCSGVTVQPGSQCAVDVTFTPNVLGASTGTMNFPVAYTNKTSATLQVKLNGIGLAVNDQAALSPNSLNFADLGVGTISRPSTVTLTNIGNESLTVGILTGINAIVGQSNTGEFSTRPNAGSDACSGATLIPGATCSIQVALTPSGTGTRTGSISFPLTYSDQHSSTLVLALAGHGLTAVRQLTISPASVAFPADLQNDPNANVEQSISVMNTGDAPVAIGNDVISTNSSDFQLSSDTCASSALAPGATCVLNVRFNPAATSTGTRNGVLIIADNAAGGPHIIALSGNAITASQQIVLSQTALNFGTQKAGTTSDTQLVYITNQGPAEVTPGSIVLGGADAADFQMTGSCYYFDPSCSIAVAFSPRAGVSGTRTATITETDSAPGSPRVITLTGTAN